MTTKPIETVSFDDVKAIAETPMAILCVIDGVEHWIPRSQISKDSEVKEKEDEGELIVSQWIAEKKGLV